MAAGGARSLVLGSALGRCVAVLTGCSTPGTPDATAEFRRVEGWGVTAEQSGTGLVRPGSATRLTPVVYEEMRELRDTDGSDPRTLEVATATADEACREEVDYDQTTLDIRSARNTEFVAEHQDALDAMVIAVQESTPRLPDKKDAP